VLTIISNTFAFGPPGTVVGLGGSIVPPGLTNMVAVSAGSHSLAIRSDGTVVGWGSNLSGEATPPEGLSNAVAVAAGRDFSVVLKADGTITTWGYSAKIKDMPAGLFGVIGIAAAQDYTVAVKADGTAVSWGGINVAVPTGTNLAAVAAAYPFSRGLRSDGTVEIPTDVPFAQEPIVISNIVAIAGGGFRCVMLRNDGIVLIEDWGSRSANPVAGISNVVAVSSGLALRSDGTVAGFDGIEPVGLTNVTAISGGVGNGLVITTNPPLPMLMARTSEGDISLSAPVSVSGYVLEAADNPNGPFTIIETFTNAPSPLVYPQNELKQYFRFRKL
jgi:hypothetical protein